MSSYTRMGRPPTPPNKPIVTITLRVPAELKQNRKAIMKKLAAEIMNRVATVGNAPKLAEFAQNEGF